MNMEVTSVSKKEQKLSQVAAAIFVITPEDIRRSGATSIPDLLRMVPGMNVAQINSNTWAISARGFSVVQAEGSNPRHQAQLRSHLKLWRDFAWDADAYFVGRLPAQAVASYTRLDTQLTWRIRESLGLSLVGQNLLGDRHAEFNDAFQSVNSSQIKRSAYA